MLVIALLLKTQFTGPLYSIPLFVAGSTTALGFAFWTETCASSIITTVLTDQSDKSNMNLSMIDGVWNALGRAFGSFIITLIICFVEYNALNCILYQIWLLALLAVCGFFFCMYDKIDTSSYVRVNKIVNTIQ